MILFKELKKTIEERTFISGISSSVSIELILKPIISNSTVDSANPNFLYPFKLIVRIVPENRSEGYSHKYFPPKEYEYSLYMSTNEYVEYELDTWKYFRKEISPKIGKLVYN